MRYQLFHHRLFEKEILKIPAHHQKKVYRLAVTLTEHPRKLPGNTNTVKGFKNTFRIRIGKFRLIYILNHHKKTVTFLGIQSRGQIYRILNRILTRKS